MKKRYMCPMTTTIMAETCSICAGSPPKWVVDKNQDDTEVPEYNWGEIIWDEGQFKKEEDPFDSDNW
uniref:hypothetical protein n=1 Tax=Prevotella sp. TaxID=59823 RepID=UPI002666BEFF|nr:hypothetical protein [uncultured Prevotella sp.]